MGYKKFALWASAFALLTATVPALAHHSISAEFDATKEWTATGTLARVDWVNPHIATWIEGKDEKTGQVVKMGCEGPPPATLHRAGLNKSDWKIGEQVVITCNNAKDGTTGWGFLKEIKYLSDGHVVVIRVFGD